MLWQSLQQYCKALHCSSVHYSFLTLYIYILYPAFGIVHLIQLNIFFSSNQKLIFFIVNYLNPHPNADQIHYLKWILNLCIYLLIYRLLVHGLLIYMPLPSILLFSAGLCKQMDKLTGDVNRSNELVLSCFIFTTL